MAHYIAHWVICISELVVNQQIGFAKVESLMIPMPATFHHVSTEFFSQMVVGLGVGA